MNWQPKHAHITTPNLSRGIGAKRIPYFLDPRFKDTPGLGRDPYHMTNEERAAFKASIGQSCFAPATPKAQTIAEQLKEIGQMEKTNARLAGLKAA